LSTHLLDRRATGERDARLPNLVNDPLRAESLPCHRMRPSWSTQGTRYLKLDRVEGQISLTVGVVVGPSVPASDNPQLPPRIPSAPNPPPASSLPPIIPPLRDRPLAPLPSQTRTALHRVRAFGRRSRVRRDC
jgi:hypothetical protein